MYTGKESDHMQCYSIKVTKTYTKADFDITIIDKIILSGILVVPIFVSQVKAFFNKDVAEPTTSHPGYHRNKSLKNDFKTQAS